MPTATPKSQDIRELVERFHVCQDVWPEYMFIEHEKRQIGFELDLSGSHNAAEEHPEPGCDECIGLYKALVRIAEEVLPPAGNDTTYQFEPYDQAIHYSAQRGNRPEVVLRIRILHRKAFEQSVDPAEFQYMEILQRRLEEWGISQH